MIDYNSLICAIEKRPKQFLRNEDIYELDAFLRGVSYAIFQFENQIDEFRMFKDEWFPKFFKSYTHDWVETLNKEKGEKKSFDFFFELWKEFKNQE